MAIGKTNAIASGGKTYSLSDCSISGGILTLPDGITWDKVKQLSIIGYYGSDTTDRNCVKDPSSGKLGAIVNKVFYQDTTQPASSATSITISNSINAVYYLQLTI